MPRQDLLQVRAGTAAAWTSANPTLAVGEPGLETDTLKVKYGDGVTAWNSLSYAVGGGSGSNLVTFKNETGNHTLDADDLSDINSGENIISAGDSTGDLTVPPNSSQAFPVGTQIAIKGYNSVIEGSGVTVTPSSGSLTGLDPDVLILLIKTATNTWSLENSVASGGAGGPAIADEYPNTAAMIADQGAQEENALYYVIDASSDATVDAGWAIYRYLGTTAGDLTDYEKLGEEESLDVLGSSNGSVTVKGVYESATAAEITAGTATGGTGAELVVTPDKLASATPTVAGLKVSGAAAGSGNFRLVFIDDAGNILSDADFRIDTATNQMILGGTFLIEVPAGTTSGASLIKFLANQAQALRLGDGSTTWINLKSTTGDPSVDLLKKVTIDQSQGHVTYIIQYGGTTTSTNGGTTSQAAIAIPSGYGANAVCDILLNANDGTTVGGQIVATFKNVSGTTSRTGQTKQIHAEGGRTDTVDLNADNTNDTIDIDFTNDATTGKAFTYAYDLKVTLSPFPA